MSRDPVDKNLLQMEARRFASRCDTQIFSIERADNLRELARLASLIILPHSLAANDSARDVLRLVHSRAESRARELIQQQIQSFLRAEPVAREKLKRAMLESWSNLTGPLGHLRTWAQGKLNGAEQQDDAV